jgi:hypothetical protein
MLVDVLIGNYQQYGVCGGVEGLDTIRYHTMPCHYRNVKASNFMQLAALFKSIMDSNPTVW